MRYNPNFLSRSFPFILLYFLDETEIKSMMATRFKYLNRRSNKDYETVISEFELKKSCAYDHHVYSMMKEFPDLNFKTYFDLVYQQILENPLSAQVFPIFNDPEMAKMCFGEKEYELIFAKFNEEMEEINKLVNIVLEYDSNNKYSIDEVGLCCKLGGYDKFSKLLRALIYIMPNETPEMSRCIECIVRIIMNYTFGSSLLQFNRAIYGLEKEFLLKYICYEDLRYYEKLLVEHNYEHFSHKDVELLLIDLENNQLKGSNVEAGGYINPKFPGFIMIENHYRNKGDNKNFFYPARAVCHECFHIFQLFFSKVESLKALGLVIEQFYLKSDYNFYKKNYHCFGSEIDADLNSYIRLEKYFSKYLRSDSYSLIFEMNLLSRHRRGLTLTSKMIGHDDKEYLPGDFKFEFLQEMAKNIDNLSSYPILKKLFYDTGTPKNIFDVIKDIDVNLPPDFDDTFLEYCQYMLKDFFVSDLNDLQQILVVDAGLSEKIKMFNKKTSEKVSEVEEHFVGYANKDCISIVYVLLNLQHMITLRLEIINDYFDALSINKKDFETMVDNVKELVDCFLKCNLIIFSIYKKYADLIKKDYQLLTDLKKKYCGSKLTENLNATFLRIIPLVYKKMSDKGCAKWK